MRGVIYHNRKKRLLLIMLGLTVFYFCNFSQSHWVKRFAEDKVMEFMGGRVKVRIGKITGGIFRDMILQDVVFYPASREEGKKVFRLERMEISYRLWRVFIEKFGFTSADFRRDGCDLGPFGAIRRVPLANIGVYFSDENPFVRGFAKLYRYPDRVELMGRISSIFSGGKEKKGIRGIFLKRGNGRYDCDFLWDGRFKGTGELDLTGRKINLELVPVQQEKRGRIKVSGAINDKGDIQGYFRMDKIDLGGMDVIGDVWISYREDPEMPLFSVRAENLIINKRPFWDLVAEGRFSPEEKLVLFDNIRWGEGVALAGSISTVEPYQSKLTLLCKSVKLEEIVEMTGNANVALAGTAEMEIEFTGPIKTAAVKGRLYIGEGVLHIAEFRSIFATLGGRLPVVEVTDSRMVKDGGHIIVSGEMDFSKVKEGKAFDNMVFNTDNKVSAYDSWQIFKEEREHMVRARKDRVTLSASFEDQDLQKGTTEKGHLQKEIEFKYDLNAKNSVKFDFEEEKDFWGVEHKVEF